MLIDERNWCLVLVVKLVRKLWLVPRPHAVKLSRGGSFRSFHPNHQGVASPPDAHHYVLCVCRIHLSGHAHGFALHLPVLLELASILDRLLQRFRVQLIRGNSNSGKQQRLLCTRSPKRLDQPQHMPLHRPDSYGKISFRVEREPDTLLPSRLFWLRYPPLNFEQMVKWQEALDRRAPPSYTGLRIRSDLHRLCGVHLWQTARTRDEQAGAQSSAQSSHRHHDSLLGVQYLCLRQLLLDNLREWGRHHELVGSQCFQNIVRGPRLVHPPHAPLRALFLPDTDAQDLGVVEQHGQEAGDHSGNERLDVFQACLLIQNLFDHGNYSG